MFIIIFIIFFGSDNDWNKFNIPVTLGFLSKFNINHCIYLQNFTKMLTG